MERQSGENAHIAGYGTYFYVWCLLMALLAASIGIARLEMTRFAVFLNIFIASVKAVLVLIFFMHLRDEGWFIKIMLIMTVGALTAIIGLTFTDVWYR